ncbi:sensor histidine kinase [Marinivivus vitaminiproducens]|uniref:sensor histidine kinase n=1 Tax=Marinivivus vitaminiproducens TaxID=3035935 RepID=UPI00279A54C0|nr:ATP-binding protein [Geminicoccaceae bacterium SCSIO 64248]
MADPAKRRGRQAVGAALVLAMIGLAGWLAGWTAERAQLATLAERGQARLDLFGALLETELGRFDALPAIAMLDPDVAGVLRAPMDAALIDRLNRDLEQLNRTAGATALYVVDTQGTALAASNWREEASFVGIDLAYRPYVQDALATGSGRFYGIGTTSGEAGYYYARAVTGRDGHTIGVATVKVSLGQLHVPWGLGRERILVVDGDGVIILSSVPDWTYRTLNRLDEATLERFRAARQYGNVTLQPLPLRFDRGVAGGQDIVAIGTTEQPAPERELLAQERAIGSSGWRLLVLSELDDVSLIANAARVITMLALGLAAVMALYLMQRRRVIRLRLAAQASLEQTNVELERKVALRTADLTTANGRLQDEIVERERAEAVLRRAQDDLIHAGKLAVVGQMAAGMTHELNQPLAALRALADNGRTFLDRDRTPDALDNFKRIGQIVERMAVLTGRLKTFAHKAPLRMGPVPLAPCLEDALSLLEIRVRREGVEVEREGFDADLHVVVDAARLTQVFVNLIGNALDAMRDHGRGRLHIRIEAAGDRALIRIQDTGPGIEQSDLAQLFEPFFTTKPAGIGLGLGLTISDGIIQAAGGCLTARNHDGGGAEFVVDLPLSAPTAPARLKTTAHG